MGFFSYDCRRCGHPALSQYATNSKNAWMNKIVVVTSKNRVFTGSYDGYGRVEGRASAVRLPYKPAADVYHYSCYQLLGRPTEYLGGSRMSPDQGYFFDPEDHDLADPLKQPDRQMESALEQSGHA